MTNRIRTTHAGSLPRPLELLERLYAQDRDEPVDLTAFEHAARRGVVDAVRRQIDAGIDVVSDGEASKISYATYVRHRLSGFEGDSPRPTPRDLDEVPALRDQLAASGGSPIYRRPVCRGPVAVRDLGPLERDIARVTQAIAVAGPRETFLTAVSPGTIALFHPNEFYGSDEAYLAALASAMRVEYERIAAAGLLLQVDCPDLGLGRHSRFKALSDEAFLRRAALHVEALNDALAGIPPERIRLHVCWGNYQGPHTHDIALAVLLPVVLRARPAHLLIEAANPRHEHEWTVWRDHPLPDGKVLVPGVVDTATNVVEHPELVAQRLVRLAEIVGRDRVMAGTDCGLGTFAGYGPLQPDVAWLKLRALSDGAALASRRLWGPAYTAGEMVDNPRTG